MRPSFLPLLLALPLVASAGRVFPPEGRRAEVQPVELPFINVDGQPAKLAPGAVVRDTGNRSILPVAMPARAQAMVLRDASGEVTHVILLTAEEIAALKAQDR